MKKSVIPSAAQVIKDQLKDPKAAKLEANPKKRTPSAGAKSGVGNSDRDLDSPIVIWPEWNEAEILAEKWVGKHVFEDSEGTFALPRSLRPQFDNFKRPADFTELGTAASSTGPVGIGMISIFFST